MAVAGAARGYVFCARVADHEVVSELLGHAVVREADPMQQLTGRSEVVGLGLLGAERHGVILAPLRAEPDGDDFEPH